MNKNLPTYRNEGTLWGAIEEAGTSTIEFGQSAVNLVLQRDAALEVPKVFSDVMAQTNKMIEESEQYAKTCPNKDMQGSLDCVFDPDEQHKDAHHKGKTYSAYIKDRYQEMMQEVLCKIDNPISKKVLKGQLLEHGKHVVSKATKRELGLIRQAREHALISTLETITHNCYSDPNLYEKHKELVLSSIKGAAMPEDFTNAYTLKALQDLAKSAGMSILKTNPYAVLEECQEPKTWAKDCDVSLQDKFLTQAQHLIEHQENLQQAKFKKLVPYHFENVLSTGKGIEGVSEFLSKKDPYFVLQEAEYKKAHALLEKINSLPINEWGETLKDLAPQGVKPYFQGNHKSLQIVAEVLKQKMLLAQNDPALLIEEENASLLDNVSNLTERFLMREHLQKKKGIKNTKLLTSNERESYANELNEIINSDNADPQTLQAKLQGLLGIAENDAGLSLRITDEVLNCKEMDPMTFAYCHNFIQGNKISDDILRCLSMKKRLFSELSKENIKKLNTEIEENSDFEKYAKSMLQCAPENFADEISKTKSAIKNLARYYQLSADLSISKSVQKACKSLIADNYVKPLPNLIIPSKIIEEGKLIQIDKDAINNALCVLRSAIINGKIEYDSDVTFGLTPKGLEKEINQRKKAVLMDGKFVLSNDKKHLYFMYQVDGSYRYVMKNGQDPIAFKISELNSYQRLNTEPCDLHKVLDSVKGKNS